MNDMGSPRTLDTRASALWLRRFARTTPGIVGLVAVIVAALCVAAGLVSAAQLNSLIAQRNSVLERSEPLAYAAQNLYAALSEVDAAAASEYLSGNETAPARNRYQQALADAASALADATAGSTDSDARTAVADISVRLAAYTGLVEAARANNLQGHVIGSAYLREASSLMQSALLPGAEKIYTRNLATVDRSQRAVGSMPVIGLTLLAVALAAIAVGSVVVFARTNRQFNIGLLVAAGALVLAAVFIVVTVRLAAADVEASRTDGTVLFGQFTQARILAEQARTDETLQLIAHGDITAGEKSFFGHIDQLRTLIGPASATADGVDGWTASHRTQVQAYLDGDYPGAVALAIGSHPDGSAARFTAVEDGLRQEIEHTRATLRDGVAAAGGWLTWGPTVTLVLAVAAAAFAVTGLWPRLKEFL